MYISTYPTETQLYILECINVIVSIKDVCV